MFKPMVRVGASFDVDPVEPGHDRVEFEEAIALLRDRADGIRAWLNEDHKEDLATNAYLHEGTVERAWWHSGYQVALRDAIGVLTGKRPDGHAWTEDGEQD